MATGRNHVTADLKINANAELQNSRAFINKLDRIIDGFDFGDKMNKQLLSAQGQLKNLNKILEKVQNKSVISDNELKELVKAGKEISNIVNKTEKLYSNFNDNDWKRYSKEYIAQIEKQQKEIVKIKEKYNKETGGNFDKDLTNLDKYKQKVNNLSKEIKALNISKDSKIQDRIDEENRALQEQFEILQKVKRVEEERKIKRQNTIDNYNQNNVAIASSDGKVKVTKENTRKDMVNSEYQKMVTIFTEISKKRQEILNSGKSEKQIQKELVTLAKQYGIQNVKNTEQFDKQFKALQEQKNFYKLLKNRDQLVTEQAVTEEYEKRLRLAQELENIDKKIYSDNEIDSEKDLKIKKRKAESTLDSSRVEVTESGANLTKQAEDDIANEIVVATTEQTNKLSQEMADTRSIIEQISQYTAKLATQSERGIDGQDIKEMGDSVNSGLEKTKTDVNDFTNMDNSRIANGILTTLQIPQNSVDFENFVKENISDVTYDTDKLSQIYKQLFIEANEGFKSITIGEMEPEELEQTIQEKKKQIKVALIEALEILQIEMNSFEDDFRMAVNDEQRKKALEEQRKVEAKINKHGEISRQADVDIEKLENRLAIFKNSMGNTNNFSKPIADSAKNLEKAVEQAQYLGSAFDDIKNKVGYFLSLNYAFDLMIRKMNEASSFVKELDKDMTQIGLVLGQTSSKTWKNFDTYAKMADRLNTTVSDVTGAMKLFYQQGLNTVEVNKMVEASAIAAALGESTMAEASETLTSIINGYNLSANQAMNVTDKISMVAMVSAADFGELSTAIEKVASSAASAGLDLDHMMGYLGKMIETTREAPTNIGTALKTIVANFTQFKEDPSGLMEEGSDINKVDTALKSVGISLTDVNGDVRDLSEVLDELGKKWNGLTRNQKSYLATQIAGTRQQSRFYALMNDYERTLELVGEAKNSDGKATQQFALYQDSLTAATSRLNNEWEKFYNDMLMSDTGLKTIKNGLTSILKIANQLGPVLTSLSIVGLTKGARKLFIHFNKIKDTIDEINKKSLSLEQISQNSLAGKDTFKNYSFTGKLNNNKVTSSFNKIGNSVAESIFNKKGGNEQVTQLQNLKQIQEAMDNWDAKNKKFLKSQKELLGTILTEDEVTKTLKGNIDASAKAKIADAVSTQSDAAAHTVSAAAKWGEVAAQLALNLAITAAIAVVGLLVYAVMKGIAAEHEHTLALQEEAQKARESYEQLKELGDTYLELNKKVVKTADEKERLVEITEGLLEQYPDLIAYIDSEGKAYAKTNAEIEKYIKQKEKDAINSEANAAKAVLNDKSYKRNAVWEGFFGGINKEDDEKMYGQKQIDARDSLVNAINNMKASGVNPETYRLTTEEGMMDKRSLTNLLQKEEYNKVNEWLKAAKESANREIERINNLNDRNLSSEEKEKQIDVQKKRIDTITSTESAVGRYQSAVKDELSDIAEKIYAQRISEANLTDKKESVTTQILKQQTRKKASEMSTEDFRNYLNSQDYTDYQNEIINKVNSLSSDTVAKIEGYLTDINNDTTLTFATIKNRVEQLKRVAPEAADLLDDSLKEYEEIIKKISGGDNKKQKQVEGLKLSTVTTLGNTKDEISKDQNAESLNKVYDKILNNPQILKDLDKLDASDLGAVNEFKQKYVNILGKYGLDFLNILVKNPKYDAEKAAERLLSGLQNSSTEGTTKSEASYSEIASGESSEGAVKILTSDDENRAQNILMVGKEIKVSAEEISDSYRQAYDDVMNSTSQIISQAETKINDHIQTIRETIGNENWNFGDNIDFSKITDGEKELIKNSQQAIQNLKLQSKNAKELQNRYKTLTVAQQANVDYANFRNGTIAANEMINSLSNLASIYDVVTTKEYTQLDLINWIANDTSGQLLAALEVENGQLSLNANAMETLAELEKQEAIAAIDEQIAKVEAQIAYVESHDTVTQQQLDNIGAVNTAESGLSNNTSSYMSSMMKNWNDWATNVKTNGLTIGGIISGLITMYNKLFKAEKEGNQDSTNTVNGGGTGQSGTSDTSKTKELDKNKTLKTLNDKLEKLKALREGLNKMSGKDLLKGINGMGSYGDNGGSKDAFKEMQEKLDHFYNYLRKIEKLQSKIDKLREKRNLIDANSNYYIDDLKEENQLLEEQRKLYTAFVADEEDYLVGLRTQLKNSAYGNKVSFDNEGLIQLSQTEFTAKSEKEQERLEAFLELVNLYQEEYNEKLENEKTLIQVQVQHLENIKSMYEKILKRVEDVSTEIERQISLIEHTATMDFSSINQLGYFGDQAQLAVNGIRYTELEMAKLGIEVEALNNQIKKSKFSELFTWDEELGQWNANDKLLLDPAVQKRYEKMGYTWSSVESYIRDTVAESQALNNNIKETTEKANSFRETLKQMLENEISQIQDYFSRSTEMIDKYFNQIDRAISKIDNEGDMFGTDSGQLENKYKTLVQSSILIKQLIEQLKDSQNSITKELTDSYSKYVTFVDGVARINEQAVEDSKTLTEQQKAELKRLIAAYESSEEQIENLEDRLTDYFQQLVEMEEAKRDAIIDLKTQVHDALIEQDQKEIDDLRSKYDKMSQLDQEYYSELQQRVNDARDLRDQRQESNNISQMQARLSVLKADNGGTYNAEMIELQKQLNSALQTQADNDVNRELERIAREQQQREEDRALTISAMENVLTFKDENNWYWQEAERMWAEGQVSIQGFLMERLSEQNQLAEDRARNAEELQNLMRTAFITTMGPEGTTSSKIWDGFVTNATAVDNVNNNISYLNSMLGEGGVTFAKIDAVQKEIAGTPISYKEKMGEVYNEKVGPGINNAKDAITKMLGEKSKLLQDNQLSIVDKIGTTSAKSDGILDTGFTKLYNALMGKDSGIYSIASGIKTELEKYLGTNSVIYKYLSPKVAAEEAKQRAEEEKKKQAAEEARKKAEAAAAANKPKPNNTSNAGSGSGTAKPDLKIGSSISVKPGTKWYYDSYGTNPSGTARGGKITYMNLKGSHPYNIEGLGWIRKQDIVGYSKGGYVDYTGMANVHGTQTEPEAFLNAKQTRLFEGLRDSLVRSASNKTYSKDNQETTKEEYNIDNISIEVKQIADVDSVDKVVRRVKEEIYKDATSNKNNMAVRRR